MIEDLMIAENKGLDLFKEVEALGLIRSGLTEKELNTAIYDLAYEMYGIKKYWHKRIVRAGSNTLCPYDENPPNLTLQKDDILFLDFGPIFEDWEADVGRTFVIGNDAKKIKLRDDIERAWHQTKAFFEKQADITGAELYQYVCDLAPSYGWTFGGEIAGHLIGKFPHERLAKEDKRNYIHPDNHQNMLLPDTSGQPRHWILEIHFVDQTEQIGGFFEQVLC